MFKKRILASLTISGSPKQLLIKDSRFVDPMYCNLLYNTYLPLAQDREYVQVDFNLVHDGYEAFLFHRVVAWPGATGELYEEYQAKFSMSIREQVSESAIQNALQVSQSDGFAQCLLSVMQGVAEVMGTTVKNIGLGVGTQVIRDRYSIATTHSVEAKTGQLSSSGILLNTLSNMEAGQIIEKMEANARLIKYPELLLNNTLLTPLLFRWQFRDSREWELITPIRYGQLVSVFVSWRQTVIQTTFGPVEIRQELITDNFGEAKESLPNALRTARDICYALDLDDVVQYLVRDGWVNPILPITRGGGVIKA